MWESVLRISTFPHAVFLSRRPPHPLRSRAQASSVSLLFAFPSERGRSPRSMGFGWDGAPSSSRLSRAAIGPIALPSRLSALPLVSLRCVIDYAATAARRRGVNSVDRATSHRAPASAGARARRSQSAGPAARRARAPTCAASAPAALRPRQITQLACTSNARRSPGPVFVMSPLCCRSAELSSLGTSPRKALARPASPPKRPGIVQHALERQRHDRPDTRGRHQTLRHGIRRRARLDRLVGRRPASS